ncbi:MAG: LPS assembly lipoprotein LptE [Nitrospirales bacterium]|nr:LPS assembly lipoprotein LptE [Nitrospirales bacterium]
MLIAGYVVTGCGYQFSVEGAGPMISGGTPLTAQGPPVRVAMHTFKNQSFEPTLEFKYTQYVRRALQAGGIAEITEDERGADFILNGAILSVTLPSLAFSQTQTQESRVQVTVAVTVKDQTKGKVRWTHASTGTAEFFVGATPTDGTSGGLQFNRVLQDRALEQAGQLVAQDIADRFLTAREQGKFERVPQPEPKKTKKATQEQSEEENPNALPTDQSPLPPPALP